MDEIRIFVVDDHEILRKGLHSFFDAAPNLAWAGEAGDGESALAQIAEIKPSVVLLDLLMPGLSELDLIRQVKSISPGSKILVLTSSQEEDMVIGSLEAGAKGYLLKTCSPDALIQGIRDVAADLMNAIPAMLHSATEGRLLSTREIEVLRLIGQGQSNREIALALHLSENTVVSHVARILSKLGLDNRTQAALYSRRRGLV